MLSVKRARSRTSTDQLSNRLQFDGAGLRVSEALALSVADVDLSNALITVRDTKFFKSRLVPIGPQLASVLTEYARQRAASHPEQDTESPFFLGRRGLDCAFRRLNSSRGEPIIFRGRRRRSIA